MSGRGRTGGSVSLALGVSGTPGVGNPLTAVFPRGITGTVKWQRFNSGTQAWDDIAGATNINYMQVTADQGKALRPITTGTPVLALVGNTVSVPSAGPSALSISGAPVTTGTAGSSYPGFVVAASGGVPPYSYGRNTAASVAGLSVDSATGVVSGTVGAAGIYAGIVFSATDSASPPVTVNLAAFTLTSSAGSMNVTLSPPSGFGWTPSFGLYRSGTTYSTDFDITTIAPAVTNTIYLNPVNGNDSTAVVNNPALPAKLLSAALARTDIQRIEIQLTADYIGRTTAGWNNVSPTVSMAVVNNTPYRFISAKTASSVAPAWAVNATYSNVYSFDVAAASAAMASDVGVKTKAFDLASGGSGYAIGDTVTLPNGALITVLTIAGSAIDSYAITVRPVSLVTGTSSQTATSGAGTGATWLNNPNSDVVYDPVKLVTSLALVAAEAGTRYHDGTTLHMRARDDRNLVGDTKVVLSTTGNNGRGSATNNVAVSTKGIDFVGGTVGFYALAPSTVTGLRLAFQDTTFQGTQSNGNGLSVVCAADVYLHRCGVYYAWADGYNYHSNESDAGATLGTSPRFFENSCWGMGNGTTGSTNGSDNASTSHDRCVGIRLNCVYPDSDDRVLAETNYAKTWNLGVHAGQARNVASGQESVAALINSVVWLDGCTVRGGGNAKFVAAGGAAINYANMTGVVNSGSGEATGTIAAYTP